MGAQSRTSKRALLVTLLLGVPISAVLLWLSVRGADLDEVAETIADARPAPLVAAVAVLALMYWLQALRWRRLAKAAIRRRHAYAMLIAALAVNNVVPRLGDVLRANWMARATRSPGGRGLATVVLDRGGDLVVLAALLFVCLPLIAHDAWLDRLVIGSAVGVGVFLVALLAARAYVRRSPSEARSRERRLVRRLLRDTVDGLSEPLTLRDLMTALSLSVCAWLLWSLAAILCASSVGVEISPVEAMFLAGAVNLGVAIPSSPGYVGTYQWLVISCLALYGVDRDAALAFAVLHQACWYIPTTLTGGVLLAFRAPRRISAPSTQVPNAERARAHA